MLSLPPQRIDPKKPGPPSMLAHDWQLHYRVLFDGTPHAPMGRYLFAPELPTREAPPLTSAALFRTVDAAAVYAKLQRGDYTLDALARALRKPPVDIHRILQRLLRRDLIAVVDVITIADPIPGQHARAQVYGMRT